MSREFFCEPVTMGLKVKAIHCDRFLASAGRKTSRVRNRTRGVADGRGVRETGDFF